MLEGEKKKEYQREYMRKRRAVRPNPVRPEVVRPFVLHSYTKDKQVR